MSPSLPIDLDRSSGRPLYRQIERWIRLAIDGGRLPPGARLPGVRTLARDLGVSVVPVITAYEQLAADGYLVSRVGLGTMVAADPPGLARRVSGSAAGGAGARPDRATDGSDRAPADLPETNRWVPDGPRGSPGAREPPRDAELARRLARSWSRHLHRARLLTDAAPAPSEPGTDELGLVWLRSMLAVRAGLSRAVPAGSDQVIVTAGVQAALAAVARTWLGPGRTYAVAGAFPALARRAFDATGAGIVRLDLADSGTRLGPPRPRVDLVVVAPAIADDAETPLPTQTRRRLLEWAARSGALVLEDQREQDIRAHRLPSLASFDVDGRVIEVGGIPTEIAPGAALGYLVVPVALLGPVAAMVLAGGQAPGRVEQEALASMLESGDLDRDLRRLREASAGADGAHVGTAERREAGWTGGSAMRLRRRP